MAHFVGLKIPEDYLDYRYLSYEALFIRYLLYLLPIALIFPQYVAKEGDLDINRYINILFDFFYKKAEGSGKIKEDDIVKKYEKLLQDLKKENESTDSSD